MGSGLDPFWFLCIEFGAILLPTFGSLCAQNASRHVAHFSEKVRRKYCEKVAKNWLKNSSIFFFDFFFAKIFENFVCNFKICLEMTSGKKFPAFIFLRGEACFKRTHGDPSPGRHVRKVGTWPRAKKKSFSGPRFSENRSEKGGPRTR